MVVLDISRSLDLHYVDENVAEDNVILAALQVFLVELAELLLIHQLNRSILWTNYFI